MDVRAVSARRIRSQRISPPHFRSVTNVLGWMCAVQAQDYAMARWALALRAGDETPAAVDAAIDRGDILRTHLLRPTWHFVSPDDIYWLLDLSGQRIVASRKSRLRELGLDRATLRKATRIIENALTGGISLTREEILELIRRAGISMAGNRGSHMLGWAELHQVICSGPIRDGKRTYAMLAERVPKARRLSRGESLAELALRYFRSRGPATLRDFSWWSGLPLRDAREGLESVKGSLHCDRSGTAPLWSGGPAGDSRAGDSQAGDSQAGGVYLLPAFDEYLLGYEDRSAQLRFADQSWPVSSNGVFWPIVVAEGAVVGIWRKVSAGENVSLDVRTFRGAPRPGRKALAEAMASAVKFFGRASRGRI